jgi:uncharacterized protein with von Willebrand factor type A (vWA) domain
VDNFLENNIVRFVQILRSLGIPAGTSEALDALIAVQSIDLTNQKQFKAALKATLVKDAVHDPLFNSAFTKFFVESPLRDLQLDAKKEYTEGLEEAIKELEFQDQPLDLDQQYLDLYGQLSQESRQQVKDFLKKTSEGKNVSARFKPIVENVIKGALEYHRTHSDLPQVIPVELTGEEEIDAVLHEISHNQELVDLYFQNMASIHEKDYQEATLLIRKLARRLASRISRRYKQSSKIKRIDVRRSIRAGIKYGGTLLDLKYRQKKVQKPEILLLCDVSGSMIKYSQFTLQFMSGLAEVLPRMHAFVFAETLEKLDLMDFSFEELAQSDRWGEGTNLNVSLQQLMKNHPGLLKPQTVFIILSDTKTMEPEATARLLHIINRKIKEILWLNPLPGDQWAKYSTVKLFQQHARMWECSSLAHLSKALRHQLG